MKIQNSVFEGDISESQLMRLRDVLEKEIKQGETVRIWIPSKIIQTIQIGRHNSIEEGII